MALTITHRRAPVAPPPPPEGPLPRPGEIHWTPKLEAQLRQLWDEGLSASKIAAELPVKVSRFSVLGKVRRLKLARRA